MEVVTWFIFVAKFVTPHNSGIHRYLYSTHRYMSKQVTALVFGFRFPCASVWFPLLGWWWLENITWLSFPEVILLSRFVWQQTVWSSHIAPYRVDRQRLEKRFRLIIYLFLVLVFYYWFKYKSVDGKSGYVLMLL